MGSGNHYVDLFADEQDRTWIGVHFGSRGLGHKIATWFLNRAGAKDGMDVAPCVIRTSTDLGAQYIECMHLAGAYAYAGRDWVCQRVARILGGRSLKRCITTTISRGAKRIRGGALGRAERRNARVSRAKGVCWRNDGRNICNS